jgi:P-type Ca2+ transporter type 2C
MAYPKAQRFPGLTQAEAALRLKTQGYNELPMAKRRRLWRIAFEVLREPMFLLLLASGVVYLVLGETRDAMMLLGFVFVIIGITLYQERKTERALEALRDLASPRALVVRDGEVIRIPGREVVRDDVVLLVEGDRVPADCIVLDSNHLLVDESLLTGESMPVRKIAGDPAAALGRPGGDDQPGVYSGTIVIQGQGVARVRATGPDTEMGKIGKTLIQEKQETSPLEIETRRVIRNFAGAGMVVCVLVVVFYQLTRGSLLGGFLAGLTLAMALLPEEIPVVLTVFLALGAWRMSLKQALTRRLQAIQAIGSSTVLCVDKTGTLTLNKMTVWKLLGGDRMCAVDGVSATALPDVCHETVEYAILASQEIPVDPMEKALHELGTRALNATEHIHPDWQLVREYPLSRQLLAMSRVWKSPNGRDYVIAAKGAPEAVGDLCHLGPAQAKELANSVNAMAAEGLRMLAVARARFTRVNLPLEQHDFQFELIGLVGFTDPVRPEVKAAVEKCRTAGIRVVMITGDYAGTASNIGREIGLQSPELVITGPKMEEMSEAELRARVRTTNVFARVVPEQKLKLVNALKANSEVVVMTGDGVNDAPALRAAHVGIAMGGRGTDVAREAAAMVLLDDDFSTIVQAVRQGRRILDNLKKAFAYIFSVHVPIAGMSLLPILFRWPLVLLPVHVVFLELIIDPACSVVFEAEPEERGIMDRPPRRLDEPLFDRRTVGLALLQGVWVLLIVLAVFAVALHRGQGEADARTITFVTLIFANLGLILTNRSWTRTIVSSIRVPNRSLWYVVFGALSFLGLALYVPVLRGMFKFTALHPTDLLICLGGGVVSIAWFEVFKYVRNHGLFRGRPKSEVRS